jgi:hypothetical protein
MAHQTQRAYSSSAGTLMALYQFNAVKEKNKLDYFSFQKDNLITKVDLCKVWMNQWPVSYLKGFKSYVMPDHDVVFTKNHEIYDLTVPGTRFPTISLTIKVSGKGEQTLSLNAPEQLTVAGLKKVVARKLTIADLSQIHLQHQGCYLDANNTLEECGFESGTELFLNLSTESKEKSLPQEKITNKALEMGEGIALFDFIKADTTKQYPTKPASPQTPSWQTVLPGLNLIASCTNKVCEASTKTIYIKKGMGMFNMAEESAEATCPACNKSFEKAVNNCGFLDCLYTIKGMMQDGTKFNRENQMAPQKTFVTFEETVNGISKITKWKYLNVTTKPTV